MDLHRHSRSINRAMKLVAVSLLFLYVYGITLPEPEDILPELLYQEPDQEMLPETKPIRSKYGELEYTLTPRANYQIYGLVVELHHSDSWIDISHENDPAQSVDLCVVWGKNISTGAYQKVKYAHGDWSCSYTWSGRDDPGFNLNLFSNNHLIPHNKAEARLLKSIKVGDQVLLSGTLVDYAVTNSEGEQGGTRPTSLVRTDNGPGKGCEIIYLSGVTVLKRNMPWRAPLIDFLWVALIVLIILDIYSSIPRYPKQPETLTGRPHVLNPYEILTSKYIDVPGRRKGASHTPNPFDVKNFLKKKPLPPPLPPTPDANTTDKDIP